MKNDYTEFQFSTALKAQLKKTKKGDKIIFYNMTYSTPTGDVGALSPINFTIEE